MQEHRMMSEATELALIALGFNPDEATTKGTHKAGLEDLLQNRIFGKNESPFLLFNFGALIKLTSRIYFTQDDSRVIYESSRSIIRPIGITSFAGRNPGDNFFTLIAPEIDNSGWFWEYFPCKEHSLSISAIKDTSALYMLISMGGEHHSIDITYYGDKGMPSAVIVPFLPTKSRGEAFWKKVAQHNSITGLKECDIDVGQGSEYAGLELPCRTDSLAESIAVGYPTKSVGQKYVIRAVLKEPQSPQQFLQYTSLFGGTCDVMLGGMRVSNCTGIHSGLTAEFEPVKGYLAAGLIKHLLSPKQP